MPVTYLYTQNAYALECSDCHTTVELPYGMRSTPSFDETVAETFRWHNGNGRYLNRCRSCERAHVRRWRENRTVVASAVPQGPSLGLRRSFGVELELTFPVRVSREDIASALSRAGLSSWRVKHDGSLSAASGRHGLEIVSPVLRGEAGLDAIRSACAVLAALDAKPNRTCGMHVHHDIADLAIDDVKRMVKTWVGNQDVIDRLVSSSRRRGGSSYCTRLGSADVSRINAVTELRQLRGLNVSRYKTLNLLAYARYGTVEIRQHQGTVDAQKIVNWVLFGQALIEQSRSEAIPAQSTVETFLGRLAELASATSEYLLGRERALVGAAA